MAEKKDWVKLSFAITIFCDSVKLCGLWAWLLENFLEIQQCKTI